MVYSESLTFCVEWGASTIEIEPAASKVCLIAPPSEQDVPGLHIRFIGPNRCPCSRQYVEIPPDGGIRFRQRTPAGAGEFQIVPGKLAFEVGLGALSADGASDCGVAAHITTRIFAHWDKDAPRTGIQEWLASPKGLYISKGTVRAINVASGVLPTPVDQLEKEGRWSILWDPERRVGTIRGREGYPMPMNVEYNRGNPSARLNFPDGSALFWRNIFVSWRDSVPPEVIPPPGLLPGTEAYERCVHPAP